MSEHKDDPDGHGPLLATAVGVAAGQIAGRAVRRARRAARRSLKAAGGGRALVAEAMELEHWTEIEQQIEAMLLAQWALAAEDVEAAMHDEGLEPEDVALLGVPAGVVPS